MSNHKLDFAFPHQYKFSGGIKVESGLTKREYFAAIAMQGLLSASSHYPSRIGTSEKAIEYADALIEELNKETKKDET